MLKSSRKLVVETLENRRLLATLTVVTNTDDGPGSLRQAIVDANQLSGPDEIAFDLPADQLIFRPQSPLPTILDSLVIDAATQPGYADAPIVQLIGRDLHDSASGIEISAPNVTVRGLVISQFPYAAIHVNEANGTRIQGSYIGTNAEGTGGLGRQSIGIDLYNASNTLIGGSEAAGNVISGNLSAGVRIWGAAATKNSLQGNLIGTDATGRFSIPNYSGVFVANGATDNLIGTNADGIGDDNEGNLVSGNSNNGLVLDNAHFNTAAGNRFGTTRDGSAALSNSGSGVFITNGSHDNLIGGSSLAARNLLSGNHSNGVAIREANANRISGNLIGLGADGITAIENRRSGVWLALASGNTIGTNGDGFGDDGERNVISGSPRGISSWDADDTHIAGNFIGTDVTGTLAVPNSIGIFLSNNSTDNLVGTDADGISDASERNIVSGNLRNGIELADSSNNVIAGNWIGLGADESVVPNQSSGIWMSGSGSDNRVGGLATSERNVISGNLYEGVSITTDRNTVVGNYIGTTVDGLGAAGNIRQNVQINNGATGNQIGGPELASRNIIAAAGMNGIKIRYASDTIVKGNWIGLGADGETLLGNQEDGIHITNNAYRSIIGGYFGAGNVIAASGESGIDMLWTFRAEILGNSIGYTATGTRAASGASAIRFDRSSNNTIGDGTGPGSNSIFAADFPAVNVIGNSSGIYLRRSSIVTNAPPLDLADDGPTKNDAGDIDSGPNSLQNYRPVLTVSANPVFSEIATAPLDSLDEPKTEDIYVVSIAPDAFKTYQYLDTVEAPGSGAWRREIAAISGDQQIALITQGEATGSSEFSPSEQPTAALSFSLENGPTFKEGGTVTGTVSRGDLHLDQEVHIDILPPYPDHIPPARITIPAGQLSTPFTLQIVDDTLPQPTKSFVIVAIANEIVASGSFEIRVLRSDVWHNDILAMDVNDDGNVAPADVLAIVNSLNSGNSGYLSDTNATQLFVDTNGDQYLSPIDALLVINHLNEKGNAEGESNRSPTKSRDEAFLNFYFSDFAPRVDFWNWLDDHRRLRRAVGAEV